jgi:NitT/TauT family transport system permease protein
VSVATADLAGLAGTTVLPRARRALPLRKALMVPLALVLMVGVWELYKAVGPDKGGQINGWNLIPRAGDASMPHVHEMIRRMFRPEVARGNSRTVFAAVASATWYSFRVALLGLGLGLLFGLLIAMVMSRFTIVRRAFTPYLIASQTVPLIALAPIVVSWSGKLTIGGFEFEKWMTTALLGAFLAFFPVAVGALRGFSSPRASAFELMDSYAASGWQQFRKLQFPAALQYLLPSVRLAAAAAVVGVVVSEISIGVASGIGRLIITYAGESDPAKVYPAVFGAAFLGLAMAALVAAIDTIATRNRAVEATS